MWSRLIVFADPQIEIDLQVVDRTIHLFAERDTVELVQHGLVRYWEDTAADLEAMSAETSDPVRCLRQYPDIFRRSLENGNRLCLCSFMSAEYNDLPEAAKKEVQAFADVNVAWLSRVLSAAAVVSPEESEPRARAIFSAVAGAQLMARTRSDISLYDALIDSYREAGLLPP
jgi:TetR/AcrR family transcriptional regulator, transcriptional repressor for nem operon